MKEIFSGLDHHWSFSAPLLMRDYLHVAANKLVGFIKEEISLTAVLQSLLWESTGLLSTVFAEEPLA